MGQDVEYSYSAKTKPNIESAMFDTYFRNKEWGEILMRSFPKWNYYRTKSGLVFFRDFWFFRLYESGLMGLYGTMDIRDSEETKTCKFKVVSVKVASPTICPNMESNTYTNILNLER